MSYDSGHTFHIPVMGLGYTIDTPVKVARFGISSVVSIIQDHLVEQMREFYLKQLGETYNPIAVTDIDHRAKRISSYLNLLKQIVDTQIQKLKTEPFQQENDIAKYFELLPDNSEIKVLYRKMKMLKEGEEKEAEEKLDSEPPENPLKKE